MGPSTQTAAYLLFCASVVSAATKNDVVRLRNDLLTDYNPDIRPMYNQSEAINVTLSFQVEMIQDLNEKKQILSSSGWLILIWTDEFLKWNTSDYGGTDTLWIKLERIWLPDVTVYNRVGSNGPLGNDHDLATVTPSGEVVWAPQVNLQTRCDVDITMFPFDTQECHLALTTATSTAREIIITVKYINKSSTFHENGGWIVTSTRSVVGISQDECCFYSNILLFIKLQRRQAFFVFNTIIPVVMLSILNTAVFTLTPESGEKMTLSVTVLLSVGVFLTMITETIPKTSQSTSIMAVYLVILLGVSVTAIFLSALSLSLYHTNSRQDVPSWIKALVSCINSKTMKKFTNSGWKSGIQHPNQIKDVPSFTDDANESKAKMTKSEHVDVIDCTWRDVVMTLDRVFFWVFITITVIVSVTVFSIMLSSHPQ